VGAGRDGAGDFLGHAGGGEAAEGDGIAVADERGGFGGSERGEGKGHGEGRDAPGWENAVKVAGSRCSGYAFVGGGGAQKGPTCRGRAGAEEASREADAGDQ